MIPIVINGKDGNIEQVITDDFDCYVLTDYKKSIRSAWKLRKHLKGKAKERNYNYIKSLINELRSVRKKYNIKGV